MKVTPPPEGSAPVSGVPASDAAAVSGNVQPPVGRSAPVSVAGAVVVHAPLAIGPRMYERKDCLTPQLMSPVTAVQGSVHAAGAGAAAGCGAAATVTGVAAPRRTTVAAPAATQVVRGDRRSWRSREDVDTMAHSQVELSFRCVT